MVKREDILGKVVKVFKPAELCRWELACPDHPHSRAPVT
jgi:hypothetical protein